jgi:hypothetical protein
VGDLTGHADGITAIAHSPFRLNHLLTAASDGEIRVRPPCFVVRATLYGPQLPASPGTAASTSSSCTTCHQVGCTACGL